MIDWCTRNVSMWGCSILKVSLPPVTRLLLAISSLLRAWRVPEILSQNNQAPARYLPQSKVAREKKFEPKIDYVNNWTWCRSSKTAWGLPKRAELWFQTKLTMGLGLFGVQICTLIISSRWLMIRCTKDRLWGVAKVKKNMQDSLKLSLCLTIKNCNQLQATSHPRHLQRSRRQKLIG